MNSRARFLCADIPAADIIDADDLSRLARQCSAPRVSKTYKDSAEVRSLIATARATNAKQDWKQVHRIRRQAKRAWQQNRLADILQGRLGAISAIADGEAEDDRLVGENA